MDFILRYDLKEVITYRMGWFLGVCSSICEVFLHVLCPPPSESVKCKKWRRMNAMGFILRHSL
jgi:hypothetical protein